MEFKRFFPESNVPKVVYGPPPCFDKNKDNNADMSAEVSHSETDTTEKTNGEKKDE